MRQSMVLFEKLTTTTYLTFANSNGRKLSAHRNKKHSTGKALCLVVSPFVTSTLGAKPNISTDLNPSIIQTDAQRLNREFVAQASIEPSTKVKSTAACRDRRSASRDRGFVLSPRLLGRHTQGRYRRHTSGTGRKRRLRRPAPRSRDHLAIPTRDQALVFAG